MRNFVFWAFQEWEKRKYYCNIAVFIENQLAEHWDFNMERMKSVVQDIIGRVNDIYADSVIGEFGVELQVESVGIVEPFCEAVDCDTVEVLLDRFTELHRNSTACLKAE